MRVPYRALIFVVAFVALLTLHMPFIGLPYFWDEAGYYIPAAWDFYKGWDFVPTSTLPTGHTPLVMIYLALTWHILGYSPFVTRVAMILIASATVLASHALARRFMGREPAVWSALLLAISPLFFAQSSLVFLDLPAALFTTLAVFALMSERFLLFALGASLAVLTKETAVVLLPVAWVYASHRDRASRGAAGNAQEGRAARRARQWLALVLPLAPLLAWTLYYHHKSGFWTGNAGYLEYNLYSTHDPSRIAWSVLRRLYEIFIGGFQWLVALGAVAGYLWGLKIRHGRPTTQKPAAHLHGVASGLIVVYLVMLSVVGGAVLPRYLLPIYPVFFLGCVILIWQLPRAAGRAICVTAAVCFVAAWFINPPYPFAFENNLAYADFIRLHQDAARYLESRQPERRILTAWPATDEVSRPFLGYVARPLRVVPVEGFTERDFEKIEPESFDVLYLYSRKWEPSNNWLQRFPALLRAQQTHFGYAPQILDSILVQRFGLTLEAQFERRGQWVRVYGRREAIGSSQAADRPASR